MKNPYISKKDDSFAYIDIFGTFCTELNKPVFCELKKFESTDTLEIYNRNVISILHNKE